MYNSFSLQPICAMLTNFQRCSYSTWNVCVRTVLTQGNVAGLSFTKGLCYSGTFYLAFFCLVYSFTMCFRTSVSNHWLLHQLVQYYIILPNYHWMMNSSHVQICEYTNSHGESFARSNNPQFLTPSMKYQYLNTWVMLNSHCSSRACRVRQQKLTL